MENLTLLANKKNNEAGIAAYEDFINNEIKNPMKYQKEFLLKLLDENKDTEYGKKYNFANIKSIEDFKKNVPVIEYEDILDEIKRCKSGEKNVITAYPFDHMNETSGTIGEKKAIPFTQQQTQTFLKYDFNYMNGLYSKCFGTDWMAYKTFATSEGNYKTLDSGITIGCASSKAAEMIQGGKEALDQMMRTIYTSPFEATVPGKNIDTKYIHCRFALMERDLGAIVSGFYSHLMHLMVYIADNYQMFIDDIKNGTIDEDVKLPKEIRDSLMKKIEPMPERAKELEEVFKNGPILFMPKVWPNLKFLVGVGGDGFSVYRDTIVNQFLGDKIPHLYSGIKSTEGLYTVPFEANNENSVMCPGSCFMEFLPTEADGDMSKLLTMDELEVGKSYELIITDLCGLYRYRMFDTVLVTGFLEKTPTVQFLYRSNNTINLSCENTTETALSAAAHETAKTLGFQLFDYTVYPDKESVPGRYVFLFEAATPTKTTFPENTFNDVLLQKLCDANHEFTECYEEGLIKAPVAKMLQPETQLLYRDIQLYKGVSGSQLKPVHVIQTEEQKNFFFSLLEE
ncbi:MAG: GH3 auxin-responsive promoter family protein [Coriobacteriia bacterium]|nr:GH3 auxin-responsive promoter family protein [Coriobacteriia bacterium]